jgi:hypothetical protein
MIPGCYIPDELGSFGLLWSSWAMGVRLSGEGVEGELLLARDVEGMVGRLGLVVFGCGGPLVGEFMYLHTCTCGSGSEARRRRSKLDRR